MSWSWFWKPKPKAPAPPPDSGVPPEIEATMQEIGRAIGSMLRRLHEGHEQITKFIERHPDANIEPLNAAMQAAWQRAVDVLKPKDPFAFEFLDEVYHRVTNTAPCEGATRLDG